MSTYTPCFPPTPATPPAQRCPISSPDSSSTPISGSPAPSKVSYSARLSRSYLALASVSEYIPRPPSPTSAAVDIKRVTHLRRKFRHAIDATYRDTSSGKWAHVSEMAKLGSTRGRWQGMCSGSSVPYSLCEVHEQNPQGIAAAAECADPYPCPTVPALGFREICERVESWQADLLSPPLSQSDNQEPDLNQLHIRDANQTSPLNFPVIKQRRCEVPKAVKCKNKTLPKGHSTSRFFCGTEDPKFPDDTHHDAEGVTTSLPEPRGSPAEPESNSQAEVLDEDPRTAQRRSPAHITTASRENIQQVSELFLPPSFPTYLRTSTPPPLFTSAHLRLAKPPEIPRTEDLCTPASLHSPPPFLPSQAINGDLGSGSQSDGSLPINRKRPLQDTPSPPPGSLNRPSKRRLQSEMSTPPPKLSFGVLHADVRRSDLDISSPLNPPGHVPVIDLRQLVSSQRSRARSRHSSHGINALT